MVAVLTADQIRTFAATGSLVVPGIVAPDILDVLDNEVDRLIAELLRRTDMSATTSTGGPRMSLQPSSTLSTATKASSLSRTTWSAQAA